MLPLDWRRGLRAVRVILGLSCALAPLFAPEPTTAAIGSVFAAYTLYALLGLAWRNFEDAGFPFVTIVIDTLALFLLIACGGTRFGWQTVFVYGFTVSFAIVCYDWWCPIVVSSLAVVVLNFTQPDNYWFLIPMTAAGGALTIIVALERDLLKKRLGTASQQKMAYRREAEKAREEERKRIAADFHDGPLQSFVSFQMRLEIIQKLLQRDAPAAQDELTSLQELSRSQVNELRAFVRSMRPVDIDGSLNMSLRRITDQFFRDSGIPAAFVSSEFTDPSDPEAALEILQIVREALFNIQKHSGATRAAVGITRSDQAIELSIEDNGNGFPFSGKFTLTELEGMRLGPASIKRRVRSLGGEQAELVLESKPGQGSSLRIRIPA